MQKLYHTLYILEPKITIKKKGNALLALHEDDKTDHIPLEMIESIVIFSNATVEPEAYQLCAMNGIIVWFLTHSANVRYRVSGRINGNVIVRKKQYLLSESMDRIPAVKAMISAKISNSRFVLERFRRNHPEAQGDELKRISGILRDCEKRIDLLESAEEIRGVEAYAFKMYFEAFPYMILNSEPEFQFDNRNRRPPKDCMNALLSFVYTLLTVECVGALESAGVDPYVGFLHTDRPGKPSMALDLMEEFRPLTADRFVLRLVNLKLIDKTMFEKNKDGIYLDKKGKAVVLKEWSQMKQEKVSVAELNKMAPKGLFPHLQAQRLVRFIKGEVKEYQPMLGR